MMELLFTSAGMLQIQFWWLLIMTVNNVDVNNALSLMDRIAFIQNSLASGGISLLSNPPPPTPSSPLLFTNTANGNTEQRLQSSLLSSSSSLCVSSTETNIENVNICRNGALVPEQAIPGAYNQICMTLSERIVPLTVTKGTGGGGGETKIIPITIQQEASGSGRTGMAVWNSGLVLTRLLTKLQPIFQPQTILELGCGTGLVSIAASKLWADGPTTNIVATDGNPDVVQLAQRNIKRNCIESDDDNESNVEAVMLPWGVLNAIDFSADLVLGADLTYNSGSWRVLAETMATILSPAGIVVYLSLGHEGFNVNPEMDGFLSVCREVGGLIPVSDINGVPIDNLMKDILTPAESKQVYSSGGARVVVLRRKDFLKKQRKH